MTVLPCLVSDCSRCAALCCVALPFDKGDDFAIDKPAQTACANLSPCFSCTIHATLTASGFSGCARYDCLGAGQRVTQDVFAGKTWRDQPELLAPMSEAFAALRQIHRDLELLLAARALPLPATERAKLEALIAQHAPAVGWTPETLSAYRQSGLGKQVLSALRGLRSHV